MARCRCTNQCSCVITPGRGATVGGDGSVNDPYTVGFRFPVFADATERDAVITTPIAGDMALLLDSHTLTVWDTEWRTI